MKMHSYMTVNGSLQHASTQSQILEDQLRSATLEVGGWDQAVVDARFHRAQLDATTGLNSSDETNEPTPNGTPDIVVDGIKDSLLDVPTADALRRRLTAVSSKTDPDFSTPSIETSSFMRPSSSTASLSNYEPRDHSKPLEPHPLVDHPSEEISRLAKECSELQAELTSSGPIHVRWPDNITLKNFTVYQLIPTLVYELEYPRTNRHVTALFPRNLIFLTCSTAYDLCTFLKRRWPPSGHLHCYILSRRAS